MEYGSKLRSGGWNRKLEGSHCQMQAGSRENELEVMEAFTSQSPPPSPMQCTSSMAPLPRLLQNRAASCCVQCSNAQTMGPVGGGRWGVCIIQTTTLI